MKAVCLGVGMLLLASAAVAQEPSKIETEFVGAKGAKTGSAELTAVAGGVLIDLNVAGLPANRWVAFHIHETGTCDPGTGHESAGGHFNPTRREHGFHAARGPHAGDMPNQYVGGDGRLLAQVFNGLVTLDSGSRGIVGRALMIHAKQDDYASQPSGNAGDRLACAVIR